MVKVGVLFVSQLDPDTVLVQVTDGHVTCMRPPPWWWSGSADA